MEKGFRPSILFTKDPERICQPTPQLIRRKFSGSRSSRLWFHFQNADGILSSKQKTATAPELHSPTKAGVEQVSVLSIDKFCGRKKCQPRVSPDYWRKLDGTLTGGTVRIFWRRILARIG